MKYALDVGVHFDVNNIDHYKKIFKVVLTLPVTLEMPCKFRPLPTSIINFYSAV